MVAVRARLGELLVREVIEGHHRRGRVFTVNPHGIRLSSEEPRDLLEPRDLESVLGAVTTGTVRRTGIEPVTRASEVAGNARLVCRVGQRQSTLDIDRTVTRSTCLLLVFLVPETLGDLVVDVMAGLALGLERCSVPSVQ
jgi:hypothetical protein